MEARDAGWSIVATDISECSALRLARAFILLDSLVGPSGLEDEVLTSPIDLAGAARSDVLELKRWYGTSLSLC